MYESDLGMIAPSIGDLAGYRTAIGADDVAFFDNISPEFSSALGNRGIADRARGAAFLGVDAILISGPAAGVPFAMSDLQTAKEAVPDVPVFANTGVNAERLGEILAIADGVIVGHEPQDRRRHVEPGGPGARRATHGRGPRDTSRRAS